MEWIEPELIRVFCPAFADVFVGGEPAKGFQPFGEVVGGQEVGEMVAKLIVAVVMIPADGRFFQRPVHALDLAVIRYVIFGVCCVRRNLSKERRYGEPIRDTGAPGARRCGQAADRQWALSPSSLHGRSLRLSRMRRERGSVDVVSPASSPN